MSTDARRPDAPASGRETTRDPAVPPTPARTRPRHTTSVARRRDAPPAVPSVGPTGPAIPHLEVPITIVTTGVAR